GKQRQPPVHPARPPLKSRRPRHHRDPKERLDHRPAHTISHHDNRKAHRIPQPPRMQLLILPVPVMHPCSTNVHQEQRNDDDQQPRGEPVPPLPPIQPHQYHHHPADRHHQLETTRHQHQVQPQHHQATRPPPSPIPLE